MDALKTEKIFNALESFRIELPSWGFANTGTRFGKFIQAAEATTTEEKFSDAGQVHLLTGVCSTIALHARVASSISSRKSYESPGTVQDCRQPCSIQVRVNGIAQRTLTKRPILPQDCAAAIVWLAGDQSAKTTGHVIPVDGGLSEVFLR